MIACICVCCLRRFVAGSEEMPAAVSHKNQGRIVYVYEPTLGTFVRTVYYFLYHSHFVSVTWFLVFCAFTTDMCVGSTVFSGHPDYCICACVHPVVRLEKFVRTIYLQTN